MNTLRKYAWHSSTVAAAAALALILLVLGPLGTALAAPTSNNLLTSISVTTNAATGSGVYSTLPDITMTCDGANMTPGAGTATGLLLTISGAWEFDPGATPTLVYAGGIFAGDANAAWGSPTTLTAANTSACGAGDVLTISGVKVRPTTAGALDTTITAANRLPPNTLWTVSRITVSGATHVNVETAADGSGVVVSAQSIVPGGTVTGYAISRTGANVFVANVAATAWSLTGKTGGVVDGDLVAAGDAKSAVFTGHAAGSGVIHVTSGVLTAGDSGTITVSTATHVNVETAADGSGTVISAQKIAPGTTVTGYAISRTAANAFVANVAATTWSLTGKTGGVVDGDLVVAGDAKSAVFTGHGAGTGVIHVTSGALTPGDSGAITVWPPSPPPAPTPAPKKVLVFLPIIPLAGPPPVIVVVPDPAECPTGSVAVPPVVIPPGVGEVVVPPVALPPGAALVCVPVIAPADVVPAVVPGLPPVAPSPADTGSGGRGEDDRSTTPLRSAGLLLGVTILAVCVRSIVRRRTEQ